MKLVYVVAVTAIDTSGIDTIYELGKIVQKKSMRLAMVNPVGTVIEKLHKSKTVDCLSSTNGLYISIGEAILDITTYWKV